MTRAPINDRQGRCEESAEDGVLLALADRCEKATGPDRELDCAIAAAAHPSMVGKLTLVGEPTYSPRRWFSWQAIAPDWIGYDLLNNSPSYTASLDAAMTLLDKYGVLLHLSDIGADGLPLARVGRPDLDDVPIFVGIASCTMTDTSAVAGLALAICAAALRARAQSGAAS